MKTLKKKIEKLNKLSEEICLSISFPTHRTFPDNKQDLILLKNLISEAEKNIINRYGKRDSGGILENISKILERVDPNYNLDSLHIFVSEDDLEIIQLPITIENSEVIINHKFNLFYLEESLKKRKDYLILLLSQSGVQLYEAMNNTIISEIQNQDFPFAQNNHFITHSDKASDAKLVDNMVKEYFNKIDKAVQKVCLETELSVVVICTPRNYQHLMTVSDNISSFIGNSPINYNDVSLHSIANQTWNLYSSEL